MITHIVYYATYKDEIIYIGTGDTNRYKHVKSGTSHVYKLNELYFKDKFENTNHLKVYIYRGYTCPDIALRDETMLINTFNPCFTVRKCDKGLNKKYMIKDIQEYMLNQENCFNEMQEHLEQIKTNKDLYQETLQSIKSGNELFFTLENNKVVICEYWKDYIEYRSNIEEIEYENYKPIKNLFNFNINKLKPKPMETSVHKMILEYEELVQLNNINLLQEFLKKHELFNEWITSGITTAMMNTLGRNNERISNKAFQLRTCCQNEDYILNELNFEVGGVYTRDEIISRITDVYKKLNITCDKIKATELKKWFEIKNSPAMKDGKTVTAYKIVSKL